MKKTTIALVVFIFAFLSWGITFTFRERTGAVKSVYTAAVSEPIDRTTTPSPTTTPIGNPISIRIPVLNVTATIEQVALDKNKRMDVPKEDMDVGWYMLGPRPGELGSAVIAGHYDSRTGTPAVFYTLNVLKGGDTIEITEENGQNLAFEVIETKTVDDAIFPIDEVFTRQDRKRLNLITCAGTFSRDKKMYNERFIIYSVLKEK